MKLLQMQEAKTERKNPPLESSKNLNFNVKSNLYSTKTWTATTKSNKIKKKKKKKKNSTIRTPKHDPKLGFLRTKFRLLFRSYPTLEMPAQANCGTENCGYSSTSKTRVYDSQLGKTEQKGFPKNQN